MGTSDTSPGYGIPHDIAAVAPPTITEAEAIAWLNGYKTAWEERDVDAVLALFAPDARYRERRFGEPLLGHATLKSYFRDRVIEHQRDIEFSFTLWGVKDNELMARWEASFTWLPINGIMHLEGVCNVVFGERENGRLIGIEFNEWFDQIEIR